MKKEKIQQIKNEKVGLQNNSKYITIYSEFK